MAKCCSGDLKGFTEPCKATWRFFDYLKMFRIDLGHVKKINFFCLTLR